MIANDIVCHKEFNSSDKYFDKIKSTLELEISSVFQSANLSAVFFSIKEAAYKVMLKQNFIKAFAPAMYYITRLKTVYHQNKKSVYSGELKYDNYNFFFITTCTLLFTHSIVSSKFIDFNSVHVKIHYYPKLNYKNQTAISELQLTKQIIKTHKITYPFKIMKNNQGVPFMFTKNESKDIEVSISHDGNFVATLIYYPE